MGHVFVVENDPSSRNALVTLLSTAGHNVRNFALIEDFLCKLVPGVCGCLVLDADIRVYHQDGIVLRLLNCIFIYLYL